MILKKRILFFVTILLVQYGLAQNGATITASLDKSRILIGEPVQLKVQAFIPTGAALHFSVADSIAHFEMLEKTVLDSTAGSSGLTIHAVYTLTSFDSGHWVIPAFQLAAGIQTDSLPIDVLFTDFDPSQDYHDIKDILEVKPGKKKLAWYWYAVVMALLAGAGYWYWKRRKKGGPVIVPKLPMNPYEEAMKELEQLKREQPGAKQCHSRLTDIFRLYVLRKKEIHSLQKTTDDLVVQLKAFYPDPQQFAKLSQALRLSDFVKFAKYQPSDEDNGNCFQEIKNAIMTIEKTEINSPSLGGS